MQFSKKELEAFAKEAAKSIKTEDGEFELETPRDSDGSFEPKLVKKNQSRFTPMDEKILWLYAQGMSTG